MHTYSEFPIGVFGKSGTTKIWGGAFAPPVPPGYATLMYDLSVALKILISHPSFPENCLNKSSRPAPFMIAVMF